MEKIDESFELYGKQYRFETGELAKQATGAVLVTQGETTVLVTAVVYWVANLIFNKNYQKKAA